MTNAASASPAPDLIFGDQQRARLREIARLLDGLERVTAATHLHRLTVFLT